MAKNLDDDFASPEEVEDALNTLTPGELLKLQEFARWRIRGLGRRALGRDHHDLLSDAVIATLEGRRRWRKNAVDIFGHLKGAMRSISSNWRQKFREAEPRSESEMIPAGEADDYPGPVATARTSEPHPDRLLAAKEELGRMLALFKDDDEVCLIIEGLREGMTGPEIQRDLGLTEKQYNAGMKRLRRKARAHRS